MPFLFVSSAFRLLFLAFQSPRVLLETTVHDLEVALDTCGAANFATCTLFGYNVGHLSLLLTQACFLVDATTKKKRR